MYLINVIRSAVLDLTTIFSLLMDTLLGYLGGLHLVLNAEQYDYVFDVRYVSQAAGYFMCIHAPDTQELKPSNNGYFAPVGSVTRVSLQKEKVCVMSAFSTHNFVDN